MRRFFFLTGPLFLILTCGSLGYMELEGTSLVDGLYLTVITITTVGYGDIVPTHTAGRMFTVFLAFSGVGYVMYLFGKITETMVAGGLQKVIERRKMNKKISQLHDHYIICGFGRIGMEICSILQENNRPFVVIERDKEVIREIEQLGYIDLMGDASDDDNLLDAGIERAAGLIAVVLSDADNVYITLTARGLNPNLFILARSSGVRGVSRKLKRAGASKVISPYSIGARRMAQLIVRPTVMDYIDIAMQTDELGLCMEELTVTTNAPFVGKTLMRSGLRKEYEVIVIAIKRGDEPMIFNPKPNAVIQPGDILIVIGEGDQIEAMSKVV